MCSDLESYRSMEQTTWNKTNYVQIIRLQCFIKILTNDHVTLQQLDY